MDRRTPPGTEEGWYVLHDLRRIDWDAWREATERRRDAALSEGTEYLRRHEALEDTAEGDSAVFSMIGHKADLLVLHLRPTLEHLDRAERRFESTALAGFTERACSYVSVTEVSGYLHEDLMEGLEDIDDEGTRNYMRQRIYPTIPESTAVCFYPMDKRRDPEYNWYDLPFEERAEYMSAHGDIGREYAGEVKQIITGSVGLDDHEWGVTLFADDPTRIKHLLYEMRFDPSTSRFAEFGTFYVGRRFPPEDLGAVFDGEAVPTDEPLAGDGTDDLPDDAESADSTDSTDTESAGGASVEAATPDGSGGRPDTGDVPHEEIDTEVFASRIYRFGIDLEEYPTAGYGLLVRSETPAEDLVEEIEGLRENFTHYDTHVLTTVRADAGDTAVISLWTSERAANTASGFLADLSGAGPGVGTVLERDDSSDDDEGAGSDGDGADSTTAHGGDESIRETFAEMDIYAGTPHGEDVYALVLYSDADPGELFEELEGLRENFDRYDTHVKSAVYTANAPGDADPEGRSAVVSIWESEDAANTAGEYLGELPGIVARGGAESTFGTMGMFYTVESDYREEFTETFEEVGGILEGMDGHLETALMVNHEDDHDMFIASQWRNREDAMAFFRSEAFRDTVQWGREVLVDRPRHVFLA